jgi:hypothetical protein
MPDDLGSVVRGTLAEDVRVDGMHFAAGAPIGFECGRIVYGVLAEEQTFDKVQIPRGTQIWRSHDDVFTRGDLITVLVPEKKLVVRGLATTGAVTFDGERRLRMATLAHPSRIGAVTCDGLIELHANGALALCTLARPQVVRGVRREGTVWFRPNGAGCDGVSGIESCATP